MKENKNFAKSVELPNLLQDAIYKINVRQDMNERESFEVFSNVLQIKDKTKRGIIMGILLNGIMAKQPKADEVVGFIKAALKLDNKNIDNIPTINIGNGKKVIGVAGSGKKAIKTINVSSCATIVSASLGAYVAKPCSKATSSVSGSSDFIESLGANINISTPKMINILKKTGLGFFKIENQIKKFDSKYGGNFYAPHVLSLGLAGTILPFKPNILFYGLSHNSINVSAETFLRLGYKDFMVVSTTDDGVHFLDEIGVFGTTSIIGSRDGIIGNVKNIQPANILNLGRYDRDSLKQGDNKKDNIEKGILALSGKGSQALIDIICVNAATILYLSNKATDITDGYKKARMAIESGLAIKKLEQFIRMTGGNLDKYKKYI